MSTPKKMCFVVQGFGEKTDFRTGRKLNLDASYDVIKEAVENAGLECIRADDVQHSGVIDKPMYESILNADLVIADLSTSNVNAAYELGVRHAVRPRATIIVAEKQWDFPFDINHSSIRTYEHLGSDIGRREAKRFSADLTVAITAILADSDAVDSPLYTYVPELLPPGYGKSSTQEESDQAVTDEMPRVSRLSVPGGISSKGYTDDGKKALDVDDFVTAKVMYKKAHEMRPNDESILQKLVLATYKSKTPSEEEALWEACKLVREKLTPEVSNDPETIGLCAAIHKRLWLLTQNTDHLEESIDALERGFKLQNDYYNGINLAYVLNERAALEGVPTAEAIADFVQARRVRRKVIEICKAALAVDSEDSSEKYWLLATLWEAYSGIDDKAGIAEWKEKVEQHKESNSLPDWMLETTNAQLAKLDALLKASPLEHII